MMDAAKPKRGHVAYTEKELSLGLKMMDALEKITDMMLYFLDRRQIKFTYILIIADDENFESFLNEKKRDTDLLIPIDPSESLYVIVCQETDIEGGYRFAERITRLSKIEKQRDLLHCNVLTVSSTHYTTQQIILRLLESYLASTYKDTEKRYGQIDFSTLS